MRVEEKHNQKLLLEGNDDQHVIWALCKKHNITQNFDVIDCEGITKLITQIPVRFKQSNVETVGLIIDADADIKNRWTTIKSTLEALGFDLPVEIPIEGLISRNKNTTIGVWIMPNNNSNGMLEDFISFLIPEDDKLLPIVHSVLNDIESKNLNEYPLIHKPKALIHTWLSWKETPGTPMGSSITKKYLNTNVQSCEKLISWLNNLFNAK